MTDDWMARPLRDRLMAIMDSEANETAATIGEAIDALDKAVAARSAALEEAAKVADERAKLCQGCVDAGDDYEFHVQNEALAIAAAIRELKWK